MNQKSHLRLIFGLLCIAAAIVVAASDFISRLSFVHIPFVSIKAPPVPELPDDNPIQDSVEHLETEPIPQDETLQIEKGDTLYATLKRAQIDETQIIDIIDRLQKVFNPKDLRPEHELYITYLPDSAHPQKRDLRALHLRTSLEYEIHIERDDEGLFTVRREEKNLTHETKVAKGTIENSLFIDAGQKGVPQKILHEMMQIFIHIIDFQRDFHRGDQFGIVYKTSFDPDSLREKPGHMAFAVLILKGKEYRIYRHTYKNGTVGYFNEKGESIKKGLLRTPIDGARISSVFGMRKHPILGYTKHHKGIDFAAPRGTPIMASGDGVIEKIGPFSSYGNYVRIRHNKEYSTAYAHLSRFGKNLKAGVRVRQGQIIGFVGMTGRTSGPHLHYELLRYNKQINPKKVTMLPAARLEGRDYTAFHHFQKSMDTLYDTHTDSAPTEDASDTHDDNIADQNSPEVAQAPSQVSS